jgi:hypothetical protein
VLQKAVGPIQDEDLARISPLTHQHVIDNGPYHFSRTKREMTLGDPYRTFRRSIKGR